MLTSKWTFFQQRSLLSIYMITHVMHLYFKVIISYNLHNKEKSSMIVMMLLKILEQVDAELRLEHKSVRLNWWFPSPFAFCTYFQHGVVGIRGGGEVVFPQPPSNSLDTCWVSYNSPQFWQYLPGGSIRFHRLSPTRLPFTFQASHKFRFLVLLLTGWL